MWRGQGGAARLQKHVLALHVDEDLVAHDAQVRGLGQLLAHQLPQIDVARAPQHTLHHRAARRGRGTVRLHRRVERRVERRLVRVEAERPRLVEQLRSTQRRDDRVRLLVGQPGGAVGAEQLAVDATVDEQRGLEQPVVGARDVEEGKALARDRAHVVGTLQQRGGNACVAGGGGGPC